MGINRWAIHSNFYRAGCNCRRYSITEDLLEQQAIIESYKPTEVRIRYVHKQLETAALLESEVLGADKLLGLLTEITPIDMRFDSLSMTSNSIELSGNSLSLQGFSTFIDGLYSRLELADIILESIESGGPRDPSINFSLTIDLSKSTPKTTPKSPANKEVVL